jgi:tRNA pseudouridine38-40 synthase
MSIGAGEKPIAWAKKTLDAKDRTKGGITAPPTGLYFVGVEYPEHFNVPICKLGPHFLPYIEESNYDVPS